MDYKLRMRINDIADSVRKAYKIKIPIENMEDIVKRMNGKLEISDSLSEFADAMIEKIHKRAESDPDFRIITSSYQTLERQRFSIAHEIGHLFLHMGYIIDEKVWNTTEETFLRKYAGEMEYQADEFAAALLMPRDDFREIVRESYSGNNQYDAMKIARYFNVSVKEVANRGRWLGYFSW